MLELKNLIPTSRYRSSDAECEKFVELFEVNDERGGISLIDAMLGQFHAHWYVASKQVRGKTFNAYWGKADGTHGAFPMFDGDPVFYDADGRFKLTQEGNFYVYGGKISLAPDQHRSNENIVLTAFHLLLAKFYNKRLDEHGIRALAKAEAVACFQHAFMDMTKNVTGLTEVEIMNEVKVKNFADGFEFAMAVGRWGHPCMPETIGGKPLFDKSRKPGDIDFQKLSDEKAGKLGMRIAPIMSSSSEGGKGKGILEHTIGNRHNKHNLCTFEELARAMGFNGRDAQSLGSEFKYCPMFVGILKEAEVKGDGILGPVGARAVADGMASTLNWAEGSQEGLWHPRWNGAPSTALEISDYVLG